MDSESVEKAYIDVTRPNPEAQLQAIGAAAEDDLKLGDEDEEDEEEEEPSLRELYEMVMKGLPDTGFEQTKPVYYKKGEVIETAQGNKISRKAIVVGSQNIIVAGNTILMNNVTLRADMAQIRIGRYCIIKENAIIRPPFKKIPPNGTFLPVNIGDNVVIERDAIVEATQIGPNVHIGEGAVICAGVMIKGCAEIEPYTVIPPNQVIPPFKVVRGNPAVFDVENDLNLESKISQLAVELYNKFIQDSNV